MNKKASTMFIIGIILIILIIGVILYFILSVEKENVQEQSEQNTESSQGEQSQACTEDWNCGSWSECTNSQQARSCTDSNNCNTVENKPSETQTCIEEIAQCFEDWNCEDWSNCQDGIKTRACSDSNGCGTSSNKPPISQTCEEEAEPCGDGTCNFPKENIYTCWKDCKPEFNTNNFVASSTSPKACSGSPTEPDCCSTQPQYTQYDSYYTCDYIGGCENDFTFCSTKCNDAGHDKPTVGGYTFDLETGAVAETKTFIQCSCKSC